MAVVGGVGSRENINFTKKNDYKSSNSFIQQKNQQFTGTFSYKNDYEAIDYSKNVSDYSNQKERSFIDEGFQTGVTLALSTASGVLSVGEDIVDGAVIVAGGLISKLVGLIDSDTGKALESDVSEFVKKEYTEGLYSTTVDAIGLDEDIAYGKAHTVGQIAGNVAGYAAITVLTGGVATVAVSSLAAVGNASEAALNSGATFNQTLVVGAVSGVAGALSGGALDKIGKMAGEKILLQKVINPATVGKYIASGSLVSMSEPVINKTAEYFTYGKNMSDGYFNYFKETGGIVSTLMAGAVGTLSIAGNTYKSYSVNPSLLSFSKEFTDSIKQLSDYYGDAGSYINNKFKAGKTIKQIFNELNEQDKINFQNFLQNTRQGRYLASLSDEQIYSMRKYTGGSYDTINNMLRQQNISGTIAGMDAQKLINNMDAAIAKYGGLEVSTELYRAVDVNAFILQNSTYAALFDDIDVNDLNQVYSVLKVLEGKDFGDLGYMSTSPSYSASFAKMKCCPIVLDIIADEGTNGAYINQISNFYNSENELLLARDTVLQMVEVLEPEKDINGLEKIIVRCVVK